ncbi:glycosyl hydrolase [Paenibacillus sp. MY03]|uniref:glycosyl hydrolase n=1 Tax=Paenibacillus sp. MY03 TaxID=302980 RepID=UPI0015C67567|nr:glycosyl hydrolase [Paenibacillus sp. MY03]
MASLELEGGVAAAGDTLPAPSFAEPTSKYRPSPLWAWNDEMTEDRIREQLREMKANGMGGAFVNPRPGLVNPYLSEEWFELWTAALDESEKLGLKLYIYDENSYPSGFAGGHVPSQLPDCLASAVIMRELSYDELPSVLPIASGTLNRPGHPIRVFAAGKAGSSDGELSVGSDVTHLPFGEWRKHGETFLLFEIGAPETNPWLGGFAYTDLLRPEVTELFLSSTYEAYRSRYGDKLGELIPAIFTDEPEISPGNLFQQAGADFLPFSYWFAGQFEERNGYDIKDYLPCLFRDIAGDSFDRDPLKVRYDYYNTIHELWVENFLRPISEWCKEHGVAWTGHFVEHNWPYPWGRSSPAVMSLYEYMQWPAIDILRSNSLRQPGFEGTEMLMLVLREASSVANQLGRERVVCEAYGAGGWDSDFKDYKRIGDWLFVHGINFLAPHMILSSLAGARKRDHPQSFDWRQPWWGEYGRMNDYYGRLSYLLTQGETRNRILVLNPCLSTYMETPGSQQGELRVNNPPRHPDMTKFLQAVQRLCDKGWNYDLGDEYIIEHHGRIQDSAFIVGERDYDIVVYPDSMKAMRASTFKLLSEFLASGGVVLALGDVGERIEGELSPETARLAAEPGWISVRDMAGLEREMSARIVPDLVWLEPERLPAGVHYLKRDMKDGSAVYYIVNSSLEQVEASFSVAGVRAERWDAWTGDKVPVIGERTGERIVVEAFLPLEGSVLFRIYAEAEADVGDSSLVERDGAAIIGDAASCIGQEPGADDGDALSISPVHYSRNAGTEAVLALNGVTRVTPERDNMLALDYCDLQIGAKRHEGISVIHAQTLVYENHGFEANPWDNAVQFKRRLLDRNSFPQNSGFTASFLFDITKGGLPKTLELLAERGDRYALSVNGQSVGWKADGHDLEHHLRVADIASYAVEGENVIELRAEPFDILLELEAVYLSGSFSVAEVEGRWTVGQPASISLGSWREQGYPFYGYAVNYENAVRIEDTSKRYAVRLRGWGGSVASLAVNGKEVDLFGVGRGEEIGIGAYLREGDNDIRVRLCGSFRNLLGPFHDPERTRKTVWPSFWKKAPLQGQPAASDYDLLDYGLFEDFEVVVKSY